MGFLEIEKVGDALITKLIPHTSLSRTVSVPRHDDQKKSQLIHEHRMKPPEDTLPELLRLSGTEVSGNPTLKEAILALDRANMEPVMAAASFSNFPWHLRIKGLLDPDTILFVSSTPAGTLCGYLELHPRRLGNGTVYIASLQIAPACRSTRLFLRLVRAGTAWLVKDAASATVTTEVQTSNARMNRILHKLGFSFQEGKHQHTRRATASRRDLMKNRILFPLPD